MIRVPPAIGYYIAPHTPKATYDPWPALCPFCVEPMTDDDVRSFNMMAQSREPYISVFYRCHRTCHEAASDAEKQQLDQIVMAMLEAMEAKGETNGK